jgi:uncharacterized delta-60 repeat protein
VKICNPFYRLATVMTLGAVLLLLQGTTTYTRSTQAYAAIPLTEHSLGSGGYVITPIGSGDDYGWDIAIQTDGKIVTAGHTHNGIDNDFAVVRYNSDGSLDTNFGDGGYVTTDFGRDDLGFGPGIAIQTDGKMVVVGGSTSPGTYYGVWAIARYNTDGSLDTTFDGDGKATADLGRSHDWAHDVVIQSDGKIVVAGERDDMIPPDFAAARYNSDGSLDTSFDGDGIAITAFGPGYDEVEALILQGDGKIVVTGFVEVTYDQKDFALIRYNSDGSLDTTFDGDGKVTTDLGTKYDYSRAAALQTDGKIVLAGCTYTGNSTYDIAMVRYNSNGSLDTTFGSNGKVVTDLGSASESAWGVALQTDGKIVLAGYSGGDFAVLRYKTDGSLDTTFGSGGYVLTDFGSGDNYGRAVAIRTNGRIVVAGSAYNGTDYDFAIACYNTDGSPDTTCGGNTPPTVTVDQASVTVDEGQTATNGGTVSDPDDDPVTLGASVGTVINNGDETWSWSFATSDGPTQSQAVTISADDGNGGMDQVPFYLTVNNVAPTVGDIIVPLDPVQVNTEIEASADFTDPGVLDTHTAEWDWSDGTTSPGVVVETNGSGSVTGSHSYTIPGVYAVRLTVIDKDGDSGESIFKYVVVYDPEGGFVTGGGWIDSLAGAYTPDPTLTGKANFGFVSKYKKGATTPSGNTQFSFHVADLNFHSNSYDWLVIAGARAKFKGVGTINDEDQEYKFMLTAIDADINENDDFDVDRFRIKIWYEIDDTEHVVYDNGLGQDDDDDNATTEIGGGSIVIHTDKK